jgi:membrane protein implicated in regulation of membrane protease activity
MEMGATFWWVAAGVAVAAELAVGTFYLLMIALGLVVAAVAAHAGTSTSTQLALAALVAGGATVAWYLVRSRAPVEGPMRENRDLNLDIGDRVHVGAWGHDRTARVHHRGTDWTARLAADEFPHPGRHVIAAVEGNWLILRPVRPADAADPKASPN